ncbi:hypothetical protein DLAC_03530 [Tieghemostelium lacteum]|uniref:t-SNARE coiled-coil homology domain-containing protein n=1 Tax=Tieghemostelium lacteum TaxID=361077 RepID=A0A152A1A9_TIELA|nr:hypothetical protein DLAC_03530 [Tieghemostelium lacteum]|eukprot:KYR00032.1 hypothetical protein DLAC_03530 [Tieghemostelium lacteum]
MNSLIRRVEKIQKECVDVQDKSKQLQQDGNSGKFTLLRRKIGIDIKSVKELIKERDESEEVMAGSVRTVELSHHIRSKIMEVKTDTGKLERMHQKSQDRYTKKNKEDAEKSKKLELHKEEVDLAKAHIQELELKNKKRGSDVSAFIPITTSNAGTIPVLPDIDRDDFRELHKNDQIIDDYLGKISDGLQVTANIANEMNKTATRQGIMMDNLTTKTDKLEIKLENMNVRLTKMIKDIRKADRFLIDVVLICVLLGIGGFIYTLVKK